MSRTRKRNPREFYKGTKIYHPCPRHGYCLWCDGNRAHNKFKTDAESEQDLMESLAHWDDGGVL